jgi:hypothetical protein
LQGIFLFYANACGGHFFFLVAEGFFYFITAPAAGI